MNIAILPARGGSKRIKNKNIMEFFGRPMISYALQAARESGLFEKIHVSTENEEIKATVESLGFPIDFVRPMDLADDKTPLMPVLQHVLTEYQKRGKTYSTVCLLLPCAPLIDASDLHQAHALFDAQKAPIKPLVAVSTYPAPIEWAYTRAADGALSPVQPGMYAIRSQDLSPKYYDSGTFYFFDAAHILSSTPSTDKDFISYVLPRSKAVDIDNQEDLDFAKALFQAKQGFIS